MSIFKPNDEHLLSVEEVVSNFENLPDTVREAKSDEMLFDHFCKLQLGQMGYHRIFELYVDRAGKYLIQYSSVELTQKGMEEHLISLTEGINKKAYEIVRHAS